MIGINMRRKFASHKSAEVVGLYDFEYRGFSSVKVFLFLLSYLNRLATVVFCSTIRTYEDSYQVINRGI